MKRNLKQQITELHKEGLNYNQIQEKLQCSKGTISYHLGDGQKAKTLERTKKLRGEDPSYKKVNEFSNLTYRDRHSGNSRTRLFQDPLSNKSSDLKAERSFTFKDVLLKGDKCYLTGRDLDFSDTQSYHLDHIIPRSKGGSLTLDNCGLTCSQANYAKGNMMLEEFFKLCIDVVKHNKLSLE
jgi:5-methylcytosine-specific restriction endonuclease McrA